MPVQSMHLVMLDLTSAVACAAAESFIAGFKEVFCLQQYCYKCTFLSHQVYHVTWSMLACICAYGVHASQV